MRTRVTLPLVLRIVGTIQLLALWAYGLWRWTIGTLIISTLWIMLALWWDERNRVAK